ncbi:MAG TPA: hypothetical protein VNQ77_05930 [Frankiaceae bacterium]|nr:hypothetical protein [Frankiaceae bacterium]
MTDPWAAPDRPGTDPWAAPGAGWGAPPSPPPPDRRWQAPLAVVIAVALVAAVVAVTVRSERRTPSAAPSPTVSASVRPTPTPARTPRATKPPRATKVPAPQPARTYSAPPDGIPVRGRVVDTAGRPVSGATVRMSQNQGFFEGLATAFVAVFSLGLACLTDICTVPYGEGRTDANGRYTVFLEPDVDDYSLTVAVKDGPAFGADVDFKSKPLVLPDVVLWNPAVSVEQRGTRATVRFRTPPSSLGSWKSAHLSVTAGDSRLVEDHEARPGTTFDARNLVDAAAKVSVTVTVRTRLGDSTYSSSTTTRGRYRPQSRGRSCIEYMPRSGKPVRQSPCGLTDGDVTKNWTPKTPDTCGGKSCDRRFVVDLGGVRRVSYLAFHGCDTIDRIALSNDGTTWRDAGIDTDEAFPGDFCAGALSGSARYVRVTGTSGGFYTSRSELSVF